MRGKGGDAGVYNNIMIMSGLFLNIYFCMSRDYGA